MDMATQQLPQAQPQPIDLDTFVRDTLTGAIGDGGPYATRESAEADIIVALTQRAKRPLNNSERHAVMMSVLPWWGYAR